MPLKRLEIQGFKSFADKTELLFNPGVTIVVGPNGSGKSNVADAIRWVLGEQSAKSLRGAKMEDIIFSGSDKRKPVGMAEVSITIDNSQGILPLEYNEVNVTRRVYRSGESDYLINKTPCRLKDIYELFTDTGIGKEGYSIIGQGKIDEILSTKSDERRVIIEEAAGIVKYRNRKTEAVRKLNDTEQNLTRINDIITELADQIEPLSLQAQTAETFLNYKDELTALEINLLVNQLTELNDKTQIIKDDSAQLKLAIASEEAIGSTEEAKIEELRLQTNKLDEELSVLQQSIYDLGNESEKKESAINVANERTRGLEEQKVRLQKEALQQKAKLKILQDAYADDEAHLKELQQKISQLSAHLTNSQTNRINIDENILTYQNQIESDQGELIDLLNLIANKKNEINNLAQQSQNSDHRVEKLSIDSAKIKTEVTQITQNIAQIEAQIKAKNQRHLDIEKTLKKKAEQKTDLQNWLESVNEQIDELLKRIHQNQSRHKVLNEMQQHYEGFQKGVKEILLAARNNKINGICGVVAELLKVPSEYETAIEVVLSGALQNIITTTDGEAKEAINFLKQNNMGRATFLPLNTIVPATHKDDEKKAAKMSGALGFAVDLVAFDQKYSHIFAYLLGRTLVVRNVDDALKIARACHYKVRMVTLDGDVINPGGSLTGGSYNRKGANLLGRSREIEALAKEITALNEKDIELAGQQKKNTLEINNITLEIADLHREDQSLHIDKTALSKDADQFVQENTRMNREIAVIAMEQQQLRNDLEKFRQKENQLKVQLIDLSNKDSQIKNQIATTQNSLNKLMANSSLLDQQLTDCKVELAALQQEQIGQEQALTKYHQNRDEYISSINEKETELADIEQKIINLATEIEQFQISLKELVNQKTQVEDTLQTKRNQRQATYQELTGQEAAIKENQKQLTKLQNDLHNAEIKSAKLEIETDNFLTKLMEEHALSYEEALLQKTEIVNRREVTNRITELRDLITELGLINIGAIEEYLRIKERHDFLDGQYNDLEEARQSLYKVIAEIDQIMVQRFSDAFNIINQNFGEVFSQLFGGGSAQLQLTDAHNLLETGVEIIAQPPGKKSQHLSLLSGGERALTAIALLFAILKAKPSPFCVLDEIEAALDEANVDRFADFLKQFANSTQFIVISHRKGTMEVADVLYGITIDDTGVSKMVSMKFSTEEEKVS